MGRAGTRWRVLTAAGLAALTLNAVPAQAQDQAPATAPEVTAPLAPDAGSHDRPIAAALEDLTKSGYQEQEVFLAGTATVHGPKGGWGSDGRWAVSDISSQPYRTRLLIRRPVDPARFSGTVVVSWFDVGGGFDLAPEWSELGAELMRAGDVWVGVSAQELGVEGPLGARAWDPERYGSLVLPSDNLSYDVFTQAGQAIATPGAVDPLAGLAPTGRKVIAVGDSQSAQRLVTYINAFQPTADVYDGFLVISRYKGAAPLGNTVLPGSRLLHPDDGDAPFLPDPVAGLLSGPTRAEIRSDTDVPVLVVTTETEAEQDATVSRPDSKTYRTWEIAGASHFDAVQTAAIVAQLKRDFPKVPTDQLSCAKANAFPTRYALRAAVHALGAWVTEGTVPQAVPLLARDGDGDLKRDDDGNVLGGLRLPDIEVPTASHSGLSDAKGYCGLTGSTVPFPPAELADRYPTPPAYADAVSKAAADAVKAGYLLQPDADQIVADAAQHLATVTSGSSSTTNATGSSTTSRDDGVAKPSGSKGSGSSNDDSVSASAAGQATRSDRSWMATTGRDLLTPMLIGLLLLINGKVVLTVAHGRRRRG